MFKKYVLILIVFIIQLDPLIAQQLESNDYEITLPAESINSINQRDLKKHLSFIASDELKGRDTGSPELDIAAKYLASQLEYYGYKGLGTSGSFYQDVPLHKTIFKNNSLKISYKNKALNLKQGEDIAVFCYGNQPLNLSLSLVMIGDGLSELQPNMVGDKAVIRFDLNGEKAKLAESNKDYSPQMIRNKLFEMGAKVVILVIEDLQKAEKIITMYHEYSNQTRLTLEPDTTTKAYIVLKPNVLDQILLLEKNKGIDKSAFYKFNGNINISIQSDYELVKSKNVVAWLEGSDPVLKDEFVGFAAHYDHVGTFGDKIYNGANDDGSGVVGVLEIAEALSLSPPKRSTLVIFHTAEEKGLYGSEFFVENPLVPLQQITALINIDMIGSSYKSDHVLIVGSDRISPELKDINEAMNKITSSMILDYSFDAENHPEQVYYRSDHYNYAKKGIPIIFYSDEDPENYHKETDTIDKINFEKLEKITKLAYATGYFVANRKEKLIIKLKY